MMLMWNFDILLQYLVFQLMLKNTCIVELIDEIMLSMYKLCLFFSINRLKKIIILNLIKAHFSAIVSS